MPKQESTYKRLKLANKDLGWRIALAAKNDDNEGVDVLVIASKAIDALIKWADERERLRVSSVLDGEGLAKTIQQRSDTPVATVTVKLEIELTVECSNADAKKAEDGEDTSLGLQAKLRGLEDGVGEYITNAFIWVESVDDVSAEVDSGNPDD